MSDRKDIKNQKDMKGQKRDMKDLYIKALDREITYYLNLASKLPASSGRLRMTRRFVGLVEELKQARAAYIGLLDGRAQSYVIGSRSLERLDLADLFDIIDEIEDELEDLESDISGHGGRQVIPVIPMDW